MFGIAKLNSIAKVLEVAPPSGDAPAIPTLTWTGGAWITSTFNNSAAYRTSALVGRRTDGWHYLYGRADPSAGRITHNNNVNLSQAIGLLPTLVNSASRFSTGTIGGNSMVLYSNTTAVKGALGAVANWSATPTQNSAPLGAFGTTFSRSGGSNSDTAIAISNTTANTTTRAIAFWNSAGSNFHSKYTAGQGSQTFASQSTASQATGATGIGNFMGAAGFTTDNTTGRWMLGGQSGVGYRVSGGTTDFATVNGSGTTAWTQATVMTTTSLTGGGLAMAWDDFTNSKFVGVAMVADSGTTIKAKAIKWLDGSLGAEATVITGVAHTHARISKVNSVSSGFGMVLVTYMRGATASNKIYGKLVSVNSTTLELTVGPEFLISENGDSLNSSATVGVGIDAARDGTSWAFTAIWAAGSGGDGGAHFATATG